MKCNNGQRWVKMQEDVIGKSDWFTRWMSSSHLRYTIIDVVLMTLLLFLNKSQKVFECFVDLSYFLSCWTTISLRPVWGNKNIDIRLSWKKYFMSFIFLEIFWKFWNTYSQNMYQCFIQTCPVSFDSVLGWKNVSLIKVGLLLSCATVYCIVKYSSYNCAEWWKWHDFRMLKFLVFRGNKEKYWTLRNILSKRGIV